MPCPTKRQVLEILHLAGLEREDGAWVLSLDQIAAELHISERVVRDTIRRAAVRWGELEAAGAAAARVAVPGGGRWAVRGVQAGTSDPAAWPANAVDTRPGRVFNGGRIKHRRVL